MLLRTTQRSFTSKSAALPKSHRKPTFPANRAKPPPKRKPAKRSERPPAKRSERAQSRTPDKRGPAKRSERVPPTSGDLRGEASAYPRQAGTCEAKRARIPDSEDLRGEASALQRRPLNLMLVEKSEMDPSPSPKSTSQNCTKRPSKTLQPAKGKLTPPSRAGLGWVESLPSGEGH